MKTRGQTRNAAAVVEPPVKDSRKRLATSPDKNIKRTRTAFGDITNALKNVTIQSTKKQVAVSAKKIERFSSLKEEHSEHNVFSSSQPEQHKDTGIASQGSNNESGSPAALLNATAPAAIQTTETQESPVPEVVLPDLVDNNDQESYDYDKENELDPFNVPHYANDIFLYYKTREAKFHINDYMPKQHDLTQQMRAILVDWMVEIQENFELNHETLYQAVKLVDLYLDRTIVTRAKLQLVGSAALFICCKFDERCPPLADDFLYICDDSYTRSELLGMEMDILKTVDFDIGTPLTYRYIRRYAKATKTSMETLTLGRYILETCLLFYEYTHVSESFLAAAAFLLAIRMRDNGKWTKNHIRYSGYFESELEPLMWKLNSMIQGPPAAKNISTILSKYSHKVFFEVAKIPPLLSSVPV